MPNSSPDNQSADITKETLENLHRLCTETLNRSFDGDNKASMIRSCIFANDLSIWSNVLAERPEHFLFENAEQEYLIALLNLAQGQYRNAFKCLRLVLELCLQGVYLSANLVELQEWLTNAKDTNWTTLMDSERGPLSTRFCNAFFSEIQSHANNFQSLAKTLYRELSETIHGNVPLYIPLSTSFEFNSDAFSVWHEKATTMQVILHFCLCSRYLKSLSEENRQKLEESVTEQLGHIEQIRTIFGGPRTS